MIRKILIISLLLIGSFSTHAHTMEPNELIEKTTSELLQVFTENRATYEADSSKLYEMVYRIAIPHFDFDRMTRNVLGSHYSNATAEQRQQFTEEFKTLLVRTYSQALFQYSGEKITHIPAVPYKDAMIVRDEIDVNAAVPVRLEYFLGKKDGAWKVFDVRIDGISLVLTFRNSYNSIISREGLPVLIADLQKKNNQLATQ